ncbi:hypothetical protein AOQ73_04150 [Bradyrhizobium pachyrhizi]|uniref:dsDNA nuclease domain-containing protein n=1 Tax=Bradyrhizobium pachyrhizi TaxID=280333 RepID=UPI000705570A|nr:dsDNA nuclease domain-containing protein [Bradyrhizobium pachyrhizi]KRQ12307.1 hypothetical protein AOQ73_04150 [Bradyrhizobium pachyrhizi]
MDDISDAGGVAARIGFKYQDHVAASFVLEMIGDPRIVQVECETSDDITRILRFEGREFPEYVQVKTTDRDKNWTATEIASRANKNAPTSLIEKSLLADKHGPGARFRIVTRRSVNASLDEYGIPNQIARKLIPYLDQYDLDRALQDLRAVDVNQLTDFSDFERSLVTVVQPTI